MTYDGYAKLLTELGYDPDHFGPGHLLRHNSNHNLPRVYLNQRRGEVFFVVRRDERLHYPDLLWTQFDNQNASVTDAPHMEVIPKTGMESAAFADLSDRRLGRPAAYRL